MIAKPAFTILCIFVFDKKFVFLMFVSLYYLFSYLYLFRELQNFYNNIFDSASAGDVLAQLSCFGLGLFCIRL